MRKGRAEKKEILADPHLNNKTIAKFINIIMLDGKKSLAERIVYRALDIAKERLKEPDAIKLFLKAIDNVRPRFEVKPRRIGGATYQVPIEVRQDRGTALALRWIRDYATTRKGKPMEQRLADELMAAYKGEGSAVKKRQDTHKMADANKAFAHFRW